MRSQRSRTGARASILMVFALALTAFFLPRTRPAIANAGTPVSGTLSGNLSWGTGGSPYVLVDNATLAPGSSLTIQPGTEVRASGDYAFNFQGVLQAVGTAADPIKFSVQEGLNFYDGSLGSEIVWASVEDSRQFGITTRLDASSHPGPWPTIQHVLFRNNRFAIYPYYPAQGSASVTDSRFIGDSYAIAGVGGNLSVNRVAVDEAVLDTALLSNNTGQSWIITDSNLNPPSEASCSSAATGCTVVVESSEGSYSAPGDWWGTTDAAEIQRRVFDGNDDPSRPILSVGSVASKPYDYYPPVSTISILPNTVIGTDTSAMTGTAQDSALASSGIQGVSASLEDLTTGMWWNGTQWIGSEQFVAASGTTSWSFALPGLADGHQYLARTLAQDNAGNMQWGASQTMFSAASQFGLAVTVTGSGAGAVSSTPPGINCGSTCQASFNSGTEVILTATPSVTSTFAGWSGDCLGTSPCHVMMDAARSVTATFDFVPVYQPDMKMKVSNRPVIGDNVYSASAANESRTIVGRAGEVKKFAVIVQNDGNASDSFKLKSSCTRAAGYTVTFKSGSTNITSQLAAGTYGVNTLDPGARRSLTLTIKVGSSAKLKSIQSCVVTATSVNGASKRDAVKATVKKVG